MEKQEMEETTKLECDAAKRTKFTAYKLFSN